MTDLSDIFVASLEKHLKDQPYGIKTRIAKAVGISPSHLGDILAKRTYGTEEKRRAIAAFFGYLGGKYEEFLNIGRRELGLLPEGEAGGGLEAESRAAEEWKAKYMAELKSHDDTLSKLLAARRKITELESRGQPAHGAGLKRPKKKTG